MKAKSEIIEKVSELRAVLAPLMKHKDTSLVVLTSSTDTADGLFQGQAVHENADKNCRTKLGQYRDNWILDSFEPFIGGVLLTQE